MGHYTGKSPLFTEHPWCWTLMRDNLSEQKSSLDILNTSVSRGFRTQSTFHIYKGWKAIQLPAPVPHPVWNVFVRQPQWQSACGVIIQNTNSLPHVINAVSLHSPRPSPWPSLAAPSSAQQCTMGDCSILHLHHLGGTENQVAMQF